MPLHIHSDFNGWPDAVDLPIKLLPVEDRKAIAAYCSGRENPPMPNVGGEVLLCVEKPLNFSPYLPLLFTSRSGVPDHTRDVGAIKFLDRLTKYDDKVGPELWTTFLTSEVIDDSKDVLDEFHDRHMNKGMGCLYYGSRYAVSGGFDGEYQRKLLEQMTTCRWRKFFASIETKGHRITNSYFVHYLGDGCHPYHPDLKFTGTHRWIISLGCLGKEFWLKSGDTEIGIMLRHGTVVCLSAKAAGNVGNILHSAKGDARGSWVVVIETKYLGNEE
jgi:hypothetical protein